MNAWLHFGPELADECDPVEAKRRAEIGLAPARRDRPKGRINVGFHLSERSIEIIDTGVTEAGLPNRSASIEELLARELQVRPG